MTYQYLKEPFKNQVRMELESYVEGTEAASTAKTRSNPFLYQRTIDALETPARSISPVKLLVNPTSCTYLVHLSRHLLKGRN